MPRSSSSSSPVVCAVCGDRATKLRYSHYGATSCFSCRAFFRRAIEKNSYSSLSCGASAAAAVKGSDDDVLCDITVATRKKCPACRFAKCQKVGMTHSRDRGSQEAKHKIKALRKPQESGGKVDSPKMSSVADYENGEESVRFPVANPNLALYAREDKTPPASFSSSDSFRMEEIHRLDVSHSFHIGETIGEITRLMLKSFVQAAYNQTALDFNAIAWGYSVGIRKLIRFAQSLEDFTNVPCLSDKKALLLHNLDPMFNIRVGHFFGSDNENFMQQMEALAIFDITLLKRTLGWVTVAPLKWDQFFKTPWANSEEHEKQFERLMSQIRELSLEGPTASLFTVVVLFSTDHRVRDDFSSPEAVRHIETLRTKYTGLLRRHLLQRSSGDEARAREWMARFEAAVVSLRQMSDIMVNKTIKVSGEWPNLEDMI